MDSDRLSRYGKKMCTPHEWQILKNRHGEGLIPQMQTYWTAKEAAYKIYVKQGGPRKLNPKNFAVYLKGSTVQVKDIFHDTIYSGHSIRYRNYVHTILQLEKKAIIARIVRVERNTHHLLASKITHSICETLSITARMIVKTPQNVPKVKGWDLSISHCGELGAWVAQRY